MPVVLTVSGFTESGHTYDDKLGAHYTFPAIYRSLIKSGETVIFYTGKRAYSGKAPLSYLGTAIIGPISDIANTDDERTLLQCKFRFFHEFLVPVPFKLNEIYFESAANLHRRPPLYFSRGVRKLPLEDFDAILSTAESLSNTPTP